jgi:hypothetical protein
MIADLREAGFEVRQFDKPHSKTAAQMERP